ncbi:GNAT family N-acetyltransferase [Curtobacterium flaccumfaciens]|uniref:GNAT family N-acetyltransferase n=1 Tax=Curtobacterium flaccumfaciens TaxID=2035 RepID=UPI0034A0D0F7
MSLPRTTIVVGVRDGAIVACCSVALRDVTTTYLGLFAVDPGHQGGASGRDTMAWAEAFARTELGAQRTVIEVMEHHEPLGQWYSRLGYQATSARRMVPGSTPDDGAYLLEMVKQLDTAAQD